MRDDLVMVTTARRLRTAGLRWRPQAGDWCTLLDGANITADHAGLWLVTAADAEVGWATIVAISGTWPSARIATNDGLWVPTAGQLKSWLRMHGYRVTTLESPPTPTHATAPTTQPRAGGWAAAFIKLPETVADTFGAPSHSIFVHQCQALHLSGFTLRSEGMAESEAVADVVVQMLMRSA